MHCHVILLVASYNRSQFWDEPH